VAEALLDRLDVGPHLDHEARSSVPELVEGDAVEPGAADRWLEDPGPEGRAAERAALGCDEHERIWAPVLAGLEVVGEQRSEELRDPERPPRRRGLGLGEADRPVDLRAGLGDLQSAASEVDPADAKAGDLGPAQAEHPRQEHHRPVLDGHGVRESDQLVGGEESPSPGVGWELHTPARALGDEVGVDRRAKDRSQHAVVGADGRRCQSSGHLLDDGARIEWRQGSQLACSDAGDEVLVVDSTVPRGRGRPLVHGDGEVMLRPFLVGDASAGRVEPVAAHGIGLRRGQERAGVGLGGERLGSLASQRIAVARFPAVRLR